MIESKSTKIAALNDALRASINIRYLHGCMIQLGGKMRDKDKLVVTIGVDLMPDRTKDEIFKKVKEFSDFKESNDPHCEHDFGSFVVDGETINWKIDYYDNGLEYGSEDATDPEKTRRVITVMTASEN